MNTMKLLTLQILLFLFPFTLLSQEVKTNEYDRFLKKQRIEMQPLPVAGLPPKTKLSISLSALGSSLYMNLNGSGWGASTIDAGNELILLFSNDSTVTLHATGLQSFEPGLVQNTYDHRYALNAAALSALSRLELAGIRKYSFNSFSDLAIPKENSEKVKKASEMLMTEWQKNNLAQTVLPINLGDIRGHIGDSVTFCSHVYQTRYFRGSENGPTLLNLQAHFSDPAVNVLILEPDRPRFNNVPEKRYVDKDVCISGLVEMKDNTPTLIIHSKEQIRLTSPVSVSEVGYFEGDSVTVSGKIFALAFVGDSAAKETYLSMGTPDSGATLSLVIANEDLPGFGTPEVDYVNKKVKVVGKVERREGKRVIVLRNKKQVEVLEQQDNEPAFAGVKGAQVAARLPKQKTGKVPLIQTDAEFPGGEAGLASFLRKNILNPSELKPAEQKKVLVSFLVDADGSCRDIRVVESAGYVFDQEVKRVLRKMPKWKPAALRGTATETLLMLPVTFRGAEGEAGNR